MVAPVVSRMDDPITIQVDDLNPKQPVTMAGMMEEAGDVFVSHAHYFADESGRLDLGASRSIGGIFTCNIHMIIVHLSYTVYVLI